MHKRNIQFWPLLLTVSVIIVLLTFVGPAQASQPQSDFTMTAEAGFDGNCKAGNWIPIRVIVENSGPNVAAQVETSLEPTAGNRITYAYPVDLPSQSRKEIFLYAYPEGYFTRLTISLVSGKDVLESVTANLTCLTQNDLLFGVIASSPSAFNILTELDPSNGAATVAQLEPASLPDQPQAWQALDVLVIADVDTGTLSAAQRQALVTWVANGGQLVIAGGPSWQKTAAGLADLLPITPTGTQNLDNLAALQPFSQEALDSGPIIVAAAGSLAAQAEVLVEQDGLPLVARRLIGQGQVFYLAVDPSLEPLKNWDGMADFYQALFATAPDQPGWANGFINWSLAEQAATNLPGLPLPSLVLICCFLGLYVLALGPLNYLVLRLFKRGELAWISIPVLVVFFSGLAFLVGSLSRGNRPVIHRVAIVQVWPDAPQAAVHGLVGVYSPRRGTYQGEINGQFLASPIPSSFVMAERGITLLESEGQVQLPDFRIDVGGVRPLSLEGSIPTPAFDNGLVLTIDEHGVVLSGKVTNNSDLTLKDAVLMYPGGSLVIGELGPGDSYEINLPLVKAQLVGQPSAGVLSPAMFTSPFSAPTYYPYYTYESTVSEIVGTSDYYANQETYQRYLLTSAALDAYGQSNGRGGGIYLSGWNDESPLDIRMTNRSSTRTSNTTLYLVSLRPRFELANGILRLSPGMFTWRPLGDSNASQVNPYGGYLYQGEEFTLQYALNPPLAYRTVRSLTLHLQTTTTTSGPTGLEFQLWDFTAGQWVDLPDPGWGDYAIESPERYIGPGGTIQIHISNTSVQWMDISVCDFTLEVER